MDLEQLIQPVSPDAPCGGDLEFDSVFGEMERAAEAKPEQQYGDTIIPGEDPDWGALKRHAMELSSRTKDLRVGVHLTRALLATGGLEEFRDGLKLIRAYVDQYWETVHPRLDPEDDNDPTIRVNTLAGLRDIPTTLRLLRRTPVVSSPRVGRYSLYDIDVAKGEAEHQGEDEAPTTAMIEAAFMDCDVDRLRTDAAAVSESLECVQAIESKLTEQVGAANAITFDPLREVLKEAHKTLATHVAKRGATLDGSSEGDSEETESEEEAGEASEESSASAGETRVVVRKNPEEITCREDVVKTLDRLCQYYARYEPSSPLPLLLQRAKRLAAMSFLEIIQELTPEALSQAQAIGGANSSSNQEG